MRLIEMLLFIFVGFLSGFVLSLRIIRNPPKALIWGAVLGVVPLALMLGSAFVSVHGIGSVLRFAFFAIGPFVLVPIVASSAAVGMASASIVLWIGQKQPWWASWSTGFAIVALTASLTLWPVAQYEITKKRLDKDRETRTSNFIRADFEGTLAGHQVGFPASPRLLVHDNCAPGVSVGLFGCATSLANPVSIFTKKDDVLLHERRDPISFRTISVSAVEQNCRLGNDYCLTQQRVDHWCREIRPDQSDSIWCRDTLAMQFELRTDATTGPSDRYEPELTAQYTDTLLGPGQVTCFYSPDPNDTDRQGASCRLVFTVSDGVSATIGASRELIVSGNPVLFETIAVIPDYWASLTAN